MSLYRIAPQTLGCAPRSAGTPQLGDLDFSSAGIGAGTLLALGAVAVAVYALAGSPAKERAAQLAAARKRYAADVQRIKAQYGRFGKRS